MTDIPLRHAHFEGDWMEYFYDGELWVTDSVISVPSERPEWLRRSYILGFRQTPEGEWIEDLDTYVNKVIAEAQDAKETDASEGADAGRQPTAEDGIRTGAKKGSRSVPRKRVGSRVGSRRNVGTPA